MANNRSYEHLYGFDLLDTLHNFFPEIMYDDTLFIGEMENWMRYRMSVLFPTVYPRHQNLYRIYNSVDTRTMYEQWRGSRVQPIIPIIPIHSTGIRLPLNRNIAPTGTATTHPRVPPTHSYNGLPSFTTRRTRIVEPGVPGVPGVPGEPSGINNIVSYLLSGMLQEELNIPYQEDVVVAPSTQQIDRGSHIVASVAPETVCAVCQEQNPNATWRVLNCSHSFHQSCIDTWFRQNVHCPVCRADIRETQSV